MIRLAIRDTETGLDAFVEIPSTFGPALRSAIEDISNEIGGRLEGIHKYEKEDALTQAAAALGPVRAAVNAVVPAGHPDHDSPTVKFFHQDAAQALAPVLTAVRQVIPEEHPSYE